MKKYLKEVDQHRRDNVVKYIGVSEMIPTSTINYSNLSTIKGAKDEVSDR